MARENADQALTDIKTVLYFFYPNPSLPEDAMKYVFIINPKAGKGKSSDEIARKIRSFFSGKNVEYHIICRSVLGCHPLQPGLPGSRRREGLLCGLRR
jgi:hypothetical protein